jgi:hypothetical protein
MTIEGTSTPDAGSRQIAIPFFIDTLTGTYSQLGHDTITLGDNVELLEALRNAACDLG